MSRTRDSKESISRRRNVIQMPLEKRGHKETVHRAGHVGCDVSQIRIESALKRPGCRAVRWGDRWSPGGIEALSVQTKEMTSV